MSPWFVYILRCADDSFYTGIATDVDRRVREHNHSDRLAARYTRARRPVALVYREAQATRAEAARREYEIRLLRRSEKEALILETRRDGDESAPWLAPGA